MRNPEIPHEPKWRTVAEAVIILGIRDDTIWQAMHGYRKRKISVSWLDGKLIDVAYIQALHRERIRLWNMTHDYYYYLSYTAGIKDISMARSLSEYIGRKTYSWTVYLSIEMFSRVDETPTLNTTLSDRMLDFIKWAEYVIPKVERKRLENSRINQEYDMAASTEALRRVSRVPTAHVA